MTNLTTLQLETVVQFCALAAVFSQALKHRLLYLLMMIHRNCSGG